MSSAPWLTVTATLALAGTGCSHHSWPQLVPGEGQPCAAVVYPGEAQFVFPALPPDSLWPVHPSAVGDDPEYYWAVGWPTAAWGTDAAAYGPSAYGPKWRELSAVVRPPPKPVAPRLVPPAELGAFASIEVVSERSVEVHYAVTKYEEPGVRFRIDSGRPVLTLSGSKRVMRFLGWQPDSAQFSSRLPGGREVECAARIVYPMANR